MPPIPSRFPGFRTLFNAAKFELLSATLIVPCGASSWVAQVARNLGLQEAFARIALHPPARPVIQST